MMLLSPAGGGLDIYIQLILASVVAAGISLCCAGVMHLL